MGNFFAIDPFLQGLRQSKEKLIPPWMVSSYMQDVYAFAKEEYEQWLKENYPCLVDGQTGEYVGAMTTNSMEGGNWRLKYELRAAYQNDESIEARCLLIALRDSMKTFRNGRPEASFASMNSKFGYGRIMAATAKDGGVGNVIETAVRAAA
jgi:hypothetical protein